jgi:Na+/melibiose symporter-like transporter
MEQAEIAQAPHIPTYQLLLYSSPTLAISMVMMPLAFVIPAYYDAHTAATLTMIGLISMASRFFDAVTDPMIGWLSDRTRSPLGKRKPWIIAGALITAIALYKLFTPESSSGNVYYAVWSVLFFLGYTLVDVPQRAWGVELAESYDERSRLSAYLTAFTVLGTFLFWLGILAQKPLTGTTELNPDVFRWIAWFFVILLPIMIVLAVVKVPDGRQLTVEVPTLASMFASFRGNRPLWRYVAAMAVWQVGNGIFTAVLYIVIGRYMLLSASFPIFLMTYSAVLFMSMPLWLRLIHHFGKHRVWAGSWAINAIIPFAILLLEPGEVSFWPVVVLTGVQGFIAAGFHVVPMALLGDIVDYDILKTDLLYKFSNGAGLGIGLPLIAVFGYTADAVIEGSVKFGLLFTYLGLPLVFGLSAAWIIWGFPIDARRHAIIRKRIEQRAVRQARDAAIAEQAAS